MEVKGIGQNLSRKEEKLEIDSKFEELFEESQNKLENERTRIEEDKTFKIIEDLSDLKCPILENDPPFRELKQKLEIYISEMRNKGPENMEDYKYMNTLYDSLKQLLLQIIITHDKILQRNYLKRVYFWFSKKLEARLKGPKPIPALSKSIEPIRHPTSLIVTLPPGILYQKKMRTLHKEIPPPRDRLIDKPRKNIDSTAVTELPHINLKKQKMETNLNQGKPSQSFYTTSKPKDYTDSNHIEGKSNFLYYKPSTHYKEQGLEKQWLRKRNKDLQIKRVEDESNENRTIWSDAKSKLNENEVRKIENVSLGTNFEARNYNNKTFLVNKEKILDFKRMYEEPLDLPEEDDNFYDQENQSVIVARSVQKELNISNPKITVDVKEFASESKDHFQETKDSIISSDKQRINNIRRLKGKLIYGDINSMREPDNIYLNPATRENSVALSVFSHLLYKRPKAISENNKTNNLRDVPISHNLSRDTIKKMEIDEIANLKRFVAKNAIPCTGQSLKRAILSPEAYSKDFMKKENFPTAGSMLIKDPFKKSKKKKKKGKKKRR